MSLSNVSSDHTEHLFENHNTIHKQFLVILHHHDYEIHTHIVCITILMIVMFSHHLVMSKANKLGY